MSSYSCVNTMLELRLTSGKLTPLPNNVTITINKCTINNLFFHYIKCVAIKRIIKKGNEVTLNY